MCDLHLARAPAAVVLLYRGGRYKRRQMAVAVLFQLERRHRALVLALRDRHQIVPGVGHELDVLEPPVVVVLADARVRGHGRVVGLEPAAVAADGL